MRRVTGPRGSLADTVGSQDSMIVKLEGAVALIALNRPERHNALTASMGRRFLEVVLRAVADPVVRSILIAGEGNSFCAGDDLQEVKAWVDGERGRAPFDPVTHDAYYLRVCEALVKAPKPVVVAMSGVTAGAGLDIACAADYRVMGESARCGSRLSLVGHVGHAVLLPRIVGMARATNWYMTGRFVLADEALAVGLADEVVPDAEVRARATTVAEQFAAGATQAMGLFKELRERAWGQPIEAGLRLQDAYHLTTHDRVRDAERGIRAAASREPGVFLGD
ncbi:4-chlorobenzoyl coenzyme A dehalogenase-2 [Corynebacterium diphtheriae subsp. lausannense]|nr:hypothetical protein BUE64_10085 [Corynebacterium diphtheriae subsp. lausannense]OWM36435.1 hypothetical protein AZF07_01235 [Corynebacterium diphtheriae subsp. lausannense]QBZ28909.1 enoyl-CoA hydratase/isomerase family protein [Corynebacterium diphtheriae subsp. lausannense]SNW32240.1 4-chlorobenzoyl coenzyme A dehalogenase-2 [Corynebacterium belfantii]SPJ39691.1 4-chlorobenzoyl coenzyme A dehalogenase-2 [Corynebacterium diphtheriae subsp. lausannense]